MPEPILAISLRLNHKPCLVVGGGCVAYRKTRRLLAAGLAVHLIAPTINASLTALNDPELKLERTEYQSTDLSGYQLVFAATDDPAVNRRIAEDAHKSGVLCNVADDSIQADFDLPAVIQRGNLQVAVSTAGRSPALARRIADQIDNLLPEQLAEFNEAMGIVRTWLKSQGHQPHQRAQLLKTLAGDPQIDTMADMDRHQIAQAMIQRVQTSIQE